MGKTEMGGVLQARLFSFSWFYGADNSTRMEMFMNRIADLDLVKRLPLMMFFFEVLI